MRKVSGFAGFAGDAGWGVNLERMRGIGGDMEAKREGERGED